MKPLSNVDAADLDALVIPGGVEVTIGADEATASATESCGARHVPCGVTEIRVDTERKVISTPGYMLGENTVEVSKGIDKLGQTLVE